MQAIKRKFRCGYFSNFFEVKFKAMQASATLKFKFFSPLLAKSSAPSRQSRAPIRPTRSSSNFTFQTKFPRHFKPANKLLKNTNNTRKTATNLRLPSRLRLESLKKAKQLQSTILNESHKKAKQSQSATLQKSSIKNKKTVNLIPQKPNGNGQDESARKLKELNTGHDTKMYEHRKEFELVNLENSIDGKNDLQQDHTGFDSLPLHQLVKEGIKLGLNFTTPSIVQRSFILNFLNNPKGNYLVGSQTGSGKTVAYLAPIMSFLKEAELESSLEKKYFGENSKKLSEIIESVTIDGELITNESTLQTLRKTGRPRAIIIVPSRQLLEQVTKVAKQMAYYCKLRVVGLHGRSRKVRESLSKPIDILVSTPSMIDTLLKDSKISFAKTEYIIMDEADSLFDKHYNEEVKPLVQTAIQTASTQNRTLSFTLVTATFPKTLESAIRSEFDNVTRITTSSLHRTPKGLYQQFLKLDKSTTKANMLLEVIKRACSDTNRMLIFCNKIKTVSEVHAHLLSKNIQAVSMVSYKNPVEQRNDLAEFLDTKRQPEFMACVATDIASRGIDTTDVGHVVLYDFPQTTISYLHRVGRTARYGRQGRATSLLTSKDVALAETIKSSLKSRTGLSQ